VRSCLINIFSYNRFEHLRLCLLYLLNSNLMNIQIRISDDGSTDKRILDLLNRVSKDKKVILNLMPEHKPLSKVESDSAIGAARGEAVEYFLGKKYDYLLLLDDDILLGKNTVQEAIEDYTFLRYREEFTKVGALTLHAWDRGGEFLSGFMNIDGKWFSRCRLTGESVFLVDRKAIEEVGNHFSGEYKGFADIQIKKIYEKGLIYYDRSSSPYNVQHIGVGGGGSIIWKDRQPFWVTTMWTKNYPVSSKKYLQVEGFSPRKFFADAESLGSDKAAEIHFEDVKNTFDYSFEEIKMKDKEPLVLKDTVKTVSGSVEIRVKNVKTGEVVEHTKIKNLDLNNFYVQEASLLAGEGLTTKYIDRMVFGTGTVAPVVTDTGLTGTVTASGTFSASYPSTTSVQFVGTLEGSQGNGVALTEMGLMCADGTLVTRTLFGPMTKSSLFSIEISWTIEWS